MAIEMLCQCKYEALSNLHPFLSRQKSAQLLIRSPLETAATNDNRALKLKFGEHFQDGALLGQQLGVF